MDPIHSRKTLKQTIHGFFLFIKEIVIHPRQVGAIFPSSKVLAKRMVDAIAYKKNTLIVELGAGTGAITRALLASDIPNTNIIVIERSPALVSYLKQNFPQLTVIQGNAQDLAALTHEFKLPISAIVSSLPLRSLTKEDVLSIENAAKKILMPQGVFIQFTYDLRKNSPSPFSNFQKISNQNVWFNLPPARIEIYRMPSGDFEKNSNNEGGK
jgi:phosphatidylethanolamine/phosphatidyl-N-methylethanolamine N-methyltransferase